MSIRNRKSSNELSGGLKALGQKLLAGFIVWCSFHYDMPSDLRCWLLVWAGLLSL